MSITFKALGIILLVSSAWAVELLVCMGVRVCGCPISLRVRCMETAVLVLMNNAPSLASTADDITALIICNIEYCTVVDGNVLIVCHEHVASHSTAGLGF